MNKISLKVIILCISFVGFILISCFVYVFGGQVYLQVWKIGDILVLLFLEYLVYLAYRYYLILY